MPLPDRHHRQLKQLIEHAQPKSVEELQALLNSLIGAPLPDIPEEARSPEDQALELVDEARESSAAKGQQLARQAHQLWPDCIPAYEYLASSAKSKTQRKTFLEKGVEIGQRLFGAEFRKKYAGHFWQIAETRPYMRCLYLLAYMHAAEGDLSKAIVMWEDMLVLNPSDNLGVRYSLLPALLRQRDLKSYHEYRKKFDEEDAMLGFNDALADFMKGGDSPSAGKRLQKAAKDNPYIIPLLLHDALPDSLGGSYSPNSPEEAKVYASDAWQIWQEIPGALQWLKGFQSTATSARAAAKPLTRLSIDLQDILLRDPYSPLSPLQFKPGLKDEDVAHLPFLRLIRELLSVIHQAESIKLTLKGNLPRALVQAFYGLRLFPSKYVDDGTVKLMGEEDFVELNVAHTLCQIAKWTQNRKGKASLSKKGLKMLQGPQALLYQEVLKIFTDAYNWNYTERWHFGDTPTGQAGWAFVMYELLRQGDTPQQDTYYAKPYFELLPQLIKEYSDTPYFSAKTQAESTLCARFFDRFAMLFGLIEILSDTGRQQNKPAERILRRSDLAAKVFTLNAPLK